ncbi:MAG: phosphate acetyltransferase, partial [Paraglaciecola sp.]
MPRRIMLVPVGSHVGLTSVSLGLVRALHQQGIKVNFFKPVGQPRQGDKEAEKSTLIIGKTSQLKPAKPMQPSYVEEMISQNKMDTLLEEIIALFEHSSHDEDITIIEGLISTENHPYAVRLNREICNALDARLVMVTAPGNLMLNQLNEKLEIVADSYGGHKGKKVIGCIFNKVNAPTDERGRVRADLTEMFDPIIEKAQLDKLKKLPIFGKNFTLLGSVTWNFDLIAPRVIDVCNHLGAKVLFEGDYQHRRLRSVHFCAREVHNMTTVLKPGALLVISGDRNDVIVSACLAALNGTKIGALLLTGGYEPDPRILELCAQALATGLPVLLIDDNTWQTSLNLHFFNQEVPTDDEQRINRVMDHTAACIDTNWVKSLAKGATRSLRLSPPAFRYKLTQLARQANKVIVLPEGEEPRTI